MATDKSDLLDWTDGISYDSQSEPIFDVQLRTVVIPQSSFIQLLRLERRRTERSGRSFMLVLIRCDQFDIKLSQLLTKRAMKALSKATRETDLIGWYEQGTTLGLLMTEIGDPTAVAISIIKQKILLAIQQELPADEFRRLSFQFRLFPQEIDKSSSNDGNHIHYPDIVGVRTPRYTYRRFVKRAMDIIGSLLAIIITLPLCIIIAIAVKLTSRGPVLFCQKRVGRYGKEFNFYKFRTMYTGNDSHIHEEYVKSLIEGKLADSNGVFKIVNDPRITHIGRLLRKSSLDELPQFFNVLKNDMSLVGPRPPLPYEFECYQTWHKRRVQELKPGLTGLWQVEGRSRTTFDEMVRMDLRYAIEQSFWFDLIILLQTPSAILSGRGAC